MPDEDEEVEVVTPEYGEFFQEWEEMNKQEYWDRVNQLKEERKKVKNGRS